MPQSQTSPDPIVKSRNLWLVSWTITCLWWVFVSTAVATAHTGLPSLDRIAQFGIQSPALIALGLILFTPLLYLGSRTGVWAVFFAVWILAALYEISAGLHFSILGRFPSSADLSYLSQPKLLAPSVSSVLPLWWCIAFPILGATLIRHIHVTLSGAPLDPQAASTITPSLKVKGHIIWLITFVLTSGAVLTSMATRLDSQPALFSLWNAQPTIEKKTISRSTDLKTTFSRLRHSLGFSNAEYDRDFPMCATMVGQSRTINRNELRRPVVLLMIESLSNEILEWDIDGHPVTPHLRHLKELEWSHPHMFAAGTKSRQALHAIFSSVPEQPAYPLLYREPLNNLPGLPHSLSLSSFKTAYLYSGDLAFDHQNEYFARIGFQERYGLDPADQEVVFGWGYSDKEIFRRAKDWIKEKGNGDEPYFLTTATTATHHPYTLPTDAHRPYANQSIEMDRANAWANLDHELNLFLSWLDSNADGPGPYVIITGDHVGHDLNAKRIRNQEKVDYAVPFIIKGLNAKRKPLPESSQLAPASHIDIAPTILSLVDTDPLPCAWGRDLLLSPTKMSNRIVYSMSDDRTFLTYWTKSHRVDLNTKSNEWSFSTHNQIKDNGPITPKEESSLKDFADLLFPASVHLIHRDRFAPQLFSGMSITPKFKNPSPDGFILASHRGNTNGPNANNDENRLTALKRAEEAGFTWVEVDTTMTKDGEIILFHDVTIPLPSGKVVPVHSLTLAQIKELPVGTNIITLDEAIRQTTVNLLVELKPPFGSETIMDMTRRVVAILNSQPPDRHFIVDSFVRFAASSVSWHCRCETAWDVPSIDFLSDDWLAWTKEGGMGWVYVNQTMVSKEVIDRVHRHGLKIMVYTVNQFGGTPDWDRLGIDGLMTDTASAIPRISINGP
jgi:glycerophosphoryl diester phosphodiesterase